MSQSLFHRSKLLVSFYDYFQSGKQNSFNPFLTPSSRNLSRNFSFKISIFSACCLLLSFLTSFYTFSFPFSPLLLSIVYFISGTPALIRSLEQVFRLEINISLLMTLAAFFSLALGNGLEGALLLVLFSLSESIEEAIESKAQETLKNLKHLSPDKAFVVKEDGVLSQKNPLDVSVGEKVFVKVGDVVPLDGRVLQGSSSLTISHLTGEPLPIVKKEGDEVPSGAVLVDGSLTLEVTRTTKDSSLSRIITLISSAQETKPHLQRWFDRYSPRYASTVILLTFAVALLFPFLFPELGFEGSIYRALSFLVTASPCALIIATPIAYLSSVSHCARKGVLLKGSWPLDSLCRCKTLVFDKTGTLTTGKFRCYDFRSLSQNNSLDRRAILGLALSLEKGESHPLASAVLSFAHKNQANEEVLCSVKRKAGFGIQAIVPSLKDAPVYIGSFAFLEPLLDDTLAKKALEERESAAQQGCATAFLYIQKELYCFYFQDELRHDAKQALSLLRSKLHLHTCLLSGDSQTNTKLLAEKLQFSEYHGSLLPEQKLQFVQKRNQDSPVAMLGDGINDAPALASSTVGIALGKVGSLPAIEASDVILLKDSLAHLPWLFKQARRTRSIIAQNVGLAALIILLASLSSLLGYVPLWLAVILHEGGTVIVGCNGLRLLKKH